MKTGIIAIGEATLELYLAQSGAYDIHAGGAALGTAAICASLGMKAGCIGKAGRDPFGTLLTQQAHYTHIQPGFIYNRTSSTCFATYDTTGAPLLVCGDANRMLTSKDIATPLAGTISRAKYVYIGGAASLQRLLPHLHSLVRYVARHGAIPILDPGDITLHDSEQIRSFIRIALAQTELCICRKKSFLALWNAQTTDEAFARLRSISASTVVLYDDTCVHGMQLLSKTTIPALCKTPKGNTHTFYAFAAGILKGLDRGIPFRDVLKVGCTVAAVSALQRSLPTLDEVQHLYNSTYAHITL